VGKKAKKGILGINDEMSQAFENLGDGLIDGFDFEAN
jgi:hypothetical protein